MVHTALRGRATLLGLGHPCLPDLRAQPSAQAHPRPFGRAYGDIEGRRASIVAMPDNITRAGVLDGGAARCRWLRCRSDGEDDHQVGRYHCTRRPGTGSRTRTHRATARAAADAVASCASFAALVNQAAGTVALRHAQYLWFSSALYFCAQLGPVDQRFNLTLGEVELRCAPSSRRMTTGI